MGVALLSSHRRPPALVIVLAVALAALADGVARADETERAIVRRVEVRSDGAVDLSELRALVAIVPGQPLTPAAVRATLTRLRLAGLASAVEVSARPVPDGVEAVIVLRADVRVEAVELAGELPLPASRLEAALEQKAGQPLREDRLLRGVYALEKELSNEGYLEARVRLDVTVDQERKTARVQYEVVPGERWLIGEVRIDSTREVDTAALLDALRAGPGEAYRPQVLRDEPDRLERQLALTGFRLAAADALPESKRESERRVDLAYHVERGPRFELELIGGNRKELEKAGLLSFLDSGGYDEAMLLQSVASIRKHFQEKGHWQVDVTTAEERNEELLRVRLSIVPGPKLVLQEIAFAGNETLPDEELARRMALSVRRSLAPGSGRLVDEQLSADLANLRSFYAVQGFGEAKVGPAVVEELGDDRLRLVIPIEEGRRRQIGEVLFSGNHEVSSQELAAAIRLQPGGPYHRVLVDEALEQLRLAYEQRGYRSALVSASVQSGADEPFVSVRFSLLEGRRSTVEAVVLRGNVRTPSHVLRRFVPLALGDPVSSGALLEVQRALYRLGIFSRVDVTVVGSRFLHSGGTVVVEVEEGRSIHASYGIGYDSESGARGLLNLTQTNLFGRAASVSLGVLVSEREEVYRLTYRQPYLGPLPLEFRGVFYEEQEDHPDFDVARRGLQLGVQREFGRLLASLLYDYRLITLESDLAEEEIPLESRDARVASVAPVLFYDRRNDPIDPRRGWSFAITFERAFPVFAADSDFRKLFGQGTGYLDFGSWGVVASSLRLGAIENLRSETDPAFSGIDYVPAAERFFAGGRTSHRAFERDRLGLPGETLVVEDDGRVVPIGGGGLALLNLEYRFPIFGGLGGTLFTDAGNVWRRFDEIDPAELRLGLGAGLRYVSPIGPLRLEVGWALDREPYEPSYVWYVSLGNPF